LVADWSNQLKPNLASVKRHSNMVLRSASYEMSRLARVTS